MNKKNVSSSITSYIFETSTGILQNRNWVSYLCRLMIPQEQRAMKVAYTNEEAKFLHNYYPTVMTRHRGKLD